MPGDLIDGYVSAEDPQRVREKTRLNRGPVVETVVLEQIHQRTANAGLWIGGAEIHFRDPRENDGPRAHRTGLERHEQLRVFEAPTAQVRRGLRDGEDLRVGRGILERLALVVRLADDGPLVDDNAPDGHLLRIERPFRLADRRAHVPRVFILHDPRLLTVKSRNVIIAPAHELDNRARAGTSHIPCCVAW